MIYVSCYSNVWGKPNVVRISNGMPKDFVSEFSLRELYPKWVWVRYHIPWLKFIPLYNEQLSRLDVKAMAQRCEGKILCCYEKNLSKEHCHRELVREWFIKNGYECEEFETK